MSHLERSPSFIPMKNKALARRDGGAPPISFFHTRDKRRCTCIRPRSTPTDSGGDGDGNDDDGDGGGQPPQPAPAPRTVPRSRRQEQVRAQSFSYLSVPHCGSVCRATLTYARSLGLARRLAARSSAMFLIPTPKAAHPNPESRRTGGGKHKSSPCGIHSRHRCRDRCYSPACFAARFPMIQILNFLPFSAAIAVTTQRPNQMPHITRIKPRTK